MTGDDVEPRRGRRSRTRILDAAERLFADLGFDATPTARLASEAGVPKGLVFHYFPTKLDILLALLRERAPIEAEPKPPAPAADVGAALLSVADRVQAGDHVRHRLRRILFREAGRHPAIQATSEQFFREVLRQVREAIDRALPPGPPDESLRHAAAVTFTASLIQATNHMHLTGKPFDLRPVAGVVSAALGQA